ncbi:carbohydrate-binding protein [Mariniflexile gromovii]|uniref:Carbohydrate-binding protein n=1 Tax=Mariniflexile gromovii TaxID=362523 RepID=A0ABS4C036_9FLAO|nr:carbohydrate-binding protein [Mariniflexile gromovii]MBP0905817.1 carbohydrate-binding protein [Mariniflexile gromovii]
MHPGLSHKKSDLERMKYMVEAGLDPWAATFSLVQSNTFSSYNYVVQGNTSMTSLTNFALFRNDGYAAYYNALMWYITGDERHAQKCVEIFKAWVNLKSVGSTLPLESGRVIWKFLEGAEIIKHTYSGWSSSDIQKLKDMMVYPGYSTTTVPTSAIASNNVTFYWSMYNGDSGRHGNQGLFAFRGIMCMGIFMDNETMYQRALRHLKGLSHLSTDLAYPSGPPITYERMSSSNEYYDEFRSIGEKENTIQDYGYNDVIANNIWENGQNQEASRDQSHALLGPSIINTMCEMAWNQGDDIYSHLNNRLLLGYEYYFRYNLSYYHSFSDQTTPWEPTAANGQFIQRLDRTGRWKSLKINPWTGADLTRLSRGGKNTAPVYELSLGHYKSRMNVNSTSTKWLERGLSLLESSIGVEDASDPSDHPGWGGLKFRRVSPGDPISGFSGGNPVYAMNVLPKTIEAENFDYFTTSGEDKTYNDTTSGNSGNAYRTDENVDVQVCDEGGYNIGWTAAGEWLTYTVYVPSTGTYDISVRIASPNTTGKIKFYFNNIDKTGDVSIPNTGGYQTWQDLSVKTGVSLSQGVQSMKVYFSGGGFNFNKMTISASNSGSGGNYILAKRNAIGFAIDGGYGGVVDQNLELYTYINHNNLKWTEISRGGNYYSYQKYGTNVCWDGGSGGANGQDVTLQTCSSTNYNQQWEKIDAGSGYYRLQKRGTNFSLDGGNGGAIDQQVYLYTSSATNQNQQWRFDIASSSSAKFSGDKEVLSVEETIENSKVSVYPNPGSSKISIALPISKYNNYVIYDISGRATMSGQIEGDLDKMDINISHLSKGIYMISLKGNQTTDTFKFIKK